MISRHPLNGCTRALVTTRDAIGRPRHRCPSCDGVARARTLRHGEIPQSQPLPELDRPAPKPAAIHRCSKCGDRIPRSIGRPRKFCSRCASPAYLAELESKRILNDRYKQSRISAPPGIRPLPTDL